MKSLVSYLIVAAFASAISTSLIAQTAYEGLLFSQDDVVGTARFNGMGGAFSALGGDWSAVQVNPAGIGVYRTNEFSVSPAIHLNASNGAYGGTDQLDGKANFNFGNISVLGTQPLDRKGKWRSISYGAGLARSATYHRNFSASRQGSTTSMLQGFAADLTSENADPNELTFGTSYPLDAQLAWQYFLIDTVPGGLGYQDSINGRLTNQSYSSENRGAKRETNFSIGANYDDKLYIGGGVSISRIIYERETLYTETLAEQTSEVGLSNYSYQSLDSYDGYGISAQAGVIFRPINALRIGLSARTPTIYSLDLDYSTDFAYSLNDGQFIQPELIEGTYEFRIQTPWKSTLGLAYIIGKYGLISADIEYIDYASARYSTVSGDNVGQDYLNGLNDALSTGLRSTLNYRFGGEFRINQFYSIRAGYSFYSNPYDESIDGDASFQIGALGFGYRDEYFSFDIAGQYRLSKDRQYLYSPEVADPVDYTFSDYRVTATFGFRF